MVILQTGLLIVTSSMCMSMPTWIPLLLQQQMRLLPRQVLVIPQQMLQNVWLYKLWLILMLLLRVMKMN